MSHYIFMMGTIKNWMKSLMTGNALTKALKEQGYKNPESWGAETFDAEFSFSISKVGRDYRPSPSRVK